MTHDWIIVGTFFVIMMKQLIDYWWSAWNVSIVFTIRFFDNYMNGRYDVVLALTLKIKKHCSFCCIGVGHFHSGSSQNEPNDTLSPSVGRWRTGGSMCMARRFAISSPGAMWGNAIHWKCLLEALPQQTMLVLGIDWNFINLMQKNMDNKPPWWVGPTGIGFRESLWKKLNKKFININNSNRTPTDVGNWNAPQLLMCDSS